MAYPRLAGMDHLRPVPPLWIPPHQGEISGKGGQGIAERRGGRRGPESVWGSAATGLLCAAASVQVNPALAVYDLLVLGYVSSLATKLADTFASEIGKAYGTTTFLITILERAEPGTVGAVSFEGTLAAAFGGSILPIYEFREVTRVCPRQLGHQIFFSICISTNLNVFVYLGQCSSSQDSTVSMFS